MQRHRVLNGYETLQLQGIMYANLPPCVRYGAFKEVDLVELAGNAFSAFSISAVIIAMLCAAKLHKYVELPAIHNLAPLVPFVSASASTSQKSDVQIVGSDDDMEDLV